jgi:acylphosphatase
MIRYTIQFTGRVQGVGFRATTRSMARKFDVAGWVRNEHDGSVVCAVEGKAEELDRFVKKVNAAMLGFIDHTQITKSNATGEFTGFRIEY